MLGALVSFGCSSLSPLSPLPLLPVALRVLQHLLDKRRHGAWDLHLQSDHTLRPLHTDAPEVSDLHENLGEHTRFIRPPPPHIDL